MSREAEVYDLGSIEARLRSERMRGTVATAATAPTAGARDRARTGRFVPSDALAGFASDCVRSLSLFVPGASQIAQGRLAVGLLFLSWLCFLVVLCRALIGTIDRLAPTLSLLGYPVGVVFWTLGVAFVLAASIHLAAVATAFDPGERTQRHPAIPAVASLLVPGWGQVLNGDRFRALFFLAGAWLAAAAWIASSPQATDLIGTYVPVVSTWEQALRAPFVLWFVKWSLPLLLWSVSVYDAATSAIGRRG